MTETTETDTSEELNPIVLRYMEALSEAVHSLDVEHVNLKNASGALCTKLDEASVKKVLEKEAWGVLFGKLKAGKLGGYSPRGAAAGALYFVMNKNVLRNGKFDKKRKAEGVVTQDTVAKAAGCSQPTLRKVCRVIAQAADS